MVVGPIGGKLLMAEAAVSFFFFFDSAADAFETSAPKGSAAPAAASRPQKSRRVRGGRAEGWVFMENRERGIRRWSGRGEALKWSTLAAFQQHQVIDAAGFKLTPVIVLYRRQT